MAHDATKRRLQLGIELEKARRGAGMTQQQAASGLKCTQSKVTKIETDTVAISGKDLTALLRLYNPPEVQMDRIKLLAAQAKAGPSAGTLANREYLKLLTYERDAVEILAYHSERIPNLLQSEPFMLEQYLLARQLYDVTSITETRLEREELFRRTQPPKYRVVFSPSSFYRTPGGRSARLVIDQVEHLFNLMSAYGDHLFVHVLPWEANLPYVPHDLTILRFDGRAKDLVYSERGAGESRIYEGQDEVSAHLRYWHDVFAQSLSVGDTRKFLHGLIDEARSW